MNNAVREISKPWLAPWLARLDVYRNVVTQGRMSYAAEQALWTHTLEQAVLGLELGVARSLWAEGGEAP